VPSLTVGSHELHYVRRGDGPPLLLIQGLGGHHLHWGDAFLDALDPHFDLISFDHRGMGRSGRARDPFTIADLAGDAAAVLDALGVDRAHVLGISMGGMVAQELALAHGDRLLSLTLGGSYPGGPGSALTAPEVWQSMAEPALAGDREGAIRASWHANVSAAFAADQAAFKRFHAAATGAPSPVEVQILQIQAVAGHDTSRRLGEIDVPTLVVHGDDDRILPVQNARRLAELIPGARLEVLEGVGHLFWLEQPERSAQLIREHALAAASNAAG